MDVRRHEWGNTKGRGTVVKMEVTDSSGDIQISTFDGADELFARVKKGAVIQIPLAGAQIKNKNDKWNQTTHRFEITLSAVASSGVRVLDDDDSDPTMLPCLLASPPPMPTAKSRIIAENISLLCAIFIIDAGTIGIFLGGKPFKAATILQARALRQIAQKRGKQK